MIFPAGRCSTGILPISAIQSYLTYQHPIASRGSCLIFAYPGQTKPRFDQEVNCCCYRTADMRCSVMLYAIRSRNLHLGHTPWILFLKSARDNDAGKKTILHSCCMCFAYCLIILCLIASLIVLEIK